MHLGIAARVKGQNLNRIATDVSESVDCLGREKQRRPIGDDLRLPVNDDLHPPDQDRDHLFVVMVMRRDIAANPNSLLRDRTPARALSLVNQRTIEDLVLVALFPGYILVADDGHFSVLQLVRSRSVDHGSHRTVNGIEFLLEVG